MPDSSDAPTRQRDRVIEAIELQGATDQFAAARVLKRSEDDRTLNPLLA